MDGVGFDPVVMLAVRVEDIFVFLLQATLQVFLGGDKSIVILQELVILLGRSAILSLFGS